MTKKRRVIDPEGKRSAILAASAKHFAQFGFSGANTELIAKDANVSIGTVFRIFPTKEDLANTLFQIACSEQEKINIRSGITEPAINNPQDSFRSLMRGALERIQSNPQQYLFFESSFGAAFLNADSRALADKVYSQWITWITHFQSKGVFANAEIDALFAVTVGALARFARDSLQRGVPLNEKLLADFETLSWRAVTNT